MVQIQLAFVLRHEYLGNGGHLLCSRVAVGCVPYVDCAICRADSSIHASRESPQRFDGHGPDTVFCIQAVGLA